MLHFWSQIFFCLLMLQVCLFVFVCLLLLLCVASFQNLGFRIQFFFSHSSCVAPHGATSCAAPFVLLLLMCCSSHVVALHVLLLLTLLMRCSFCVVPCILALFFSHYSFDVPHIVLIMSFFLCCSLCIAFRTL